MSRTINDIPTPEYSFPEAGEHECQCVGAAKVFAKTKGTPGIELTWITVDGAHQFTDTLWMTAKAIGRFAVIGKRLFKEEIETLQLDDDNAMAVEQLGAFIMSHIVDTYALVTIDEYSETFIHESGDKIGQKETRTKRRVGFSGYTESASPF